MSTIENFNIICKYVNKFLSEDCVINISKTDLIIYLKGENVTSFISIGINRCDVLTSNYMHVVTDLKYIDRIINLAFGFKNLIPIKIALNSNLLI